MVSHQKSGTSLVLSEKKYPYLELGKIEAKALKHYCLAGFHLNSFLVHR